MRGVFQGPQQGDDKVVLAERDGREAGVLAELQVVRQDGVAKRAGQAGRGAGV